jgi:zinc protease
LYKALVESKKATGVFASARSAHDPGLFVIQAEVPDRNRIDEVRDTMLVTVESAAAEGISEEEVNRAKQQILKARALSAADTSEIAIELSDWASEGDWRLYFVHRDRVEQVTPSKVQTAAARYLLRNNRTVGVFIPTEKPERVAVPSRPDVNALVENYKGREALAAGEVFDATPANIEARLKRQELPEGVKVVLLPKKTRGQEVHVALTLRYGDENSLKDLQTAAGFLPDLMLRGTKKLSYQQLRDELDRLNATLRAGGGGGGGRRGRGGSSAGGPAGALTFSIQTKRDNLPAVLEILKQVLREPALPADQFEVMKRERLASIEQMRTEPSILASRLLSRQLAPYSKDDIRYVPTIDESIERLDAATHEQVVQLHREFLGSQAGELSIVGDFDPEACLKVLRDGLSGWTAGKRYERIATPAPTGLSGGQHKLITPDKANATYIAGLLMPLKDDDEDYPALVMANYVLGSGALSSRLGTRVRQQEGLSYSIGSGLGASSLDKRASFTISAICNPQNIGRVEKAIAEECERLLRDGVTQDELDRARQGYLRAQKVRRATDEALVGVLADLSHTGRTMEYYAELEKKIEALTPEQVVAAARKHIDPKNLVIVTAGDFEATGTSAKE